MAAGSAHLLFPRRWGVQAAVASLLAWLVGAGGRSSASREVWSGGLGHGPQESAELDSVHKSGSPRMSRGRCLLGVGAKRSLCHLLSPHSVIPPSAAIRDLSLNQAGNHSFKARGVFSRRHVPGRQPECPMLIRMVCDQGIRARRRKCGDGFFWFPCRDPDGKACESAHSKTPTK